MKSANAFTQENAVDPSVNSQAELELREELLRVQEEKNASLKKERRLQDSSRNLRRRWSL